MVPISNCRCKKCGKVTRTGKRVRLNPCGCVYCSRCALKLAMEQRTPDLVCKCNKNDGTFATPTTSYDEEYADPTDPRKGVLKNVSVPTSRESLAENKDGLRIFLRDKIYNNGSGNLNQDRLKNCVGDGLLYIGFHPITFDDVAGDITVGASDCVLPAKGQYQPDEDNVIKLLFGATFMHSSLVSLSCRDRSNKRDQGCKDSDSSNDGAHTSGDGNGGGVCEGEDGEIRKATIDESHSYDAIVERSAKNRDIIHRFSYSLSTGNIFPKMTSDDSGDSPPDLARLTSGDVDPFLASQVTASSLAADLMIRAASVDQIGDTIRSVAFQLEHAKDSQLKDLFSQLRLTQSRSHEVRMQSRAFVQKLLNTRPLGPRDLVFFSADNLQWQQGNKYDHWVTVLMHVLTEDQLTELGILKDDVQESERLSRERKEWPEYVASFPDDKRVEAILDKVFRPKEDDYRLLGEIVLAHFALVLKVLHKLPSVPDCRKRLTQRDYDFDERIFPVLLRLSTEADVQVYPTSDEETESDLDEGFVEENCPTMWKKNNIYAQPAFNANMSSRTTIRDLIDMGQRVLAEQKIDFYSKPDEYNGKEPPIDKAFFLLDGAPASTLLGMLQKDAGEQYDDIALVPAIFHLYMEIFKKTHELAIDIATFIADSFSGKNGDDDTSFFIDFNDPTKPEKQMSQTVLAIMTYVLRCLKKDGSAEGSAAEAHNYMIEMAVECPSAKALLDLTLLYEIVILSRRAARLDSKPMILSILRLSLPLFGGTHSTGYSRIAADFLKLDEVMSEMERAIQPHLLTMETVNGVRIARDQGHEKYNCLIDTNVGNYRDGKRHCIESAAMNALDREGTGSKRALEKMRYGGYVQTDRTEHWTSDGETFVKVTVLLENSGIMERRKLVKPARSRRRVKNDKYYSASSGDTLPSDLMRWRSMCTEKIEAYLIDNYIENPTRETRSEEHIKAILRTHEEAQELFKKTVILKTSLNDKQLRDFGNRKELVKELYDLLERFDNIAPPQKELTKYSNKTEIIDNLIRVRSLAFSQDENLKDTLKAEAKTCVKIATSEDEREQEVRSDKFYMFTEEVKTRNTFTSRHSL